MEGLKILRLTEDAQIPSYATSGAAGFDLYANEYVVLKENTPTIVHTGISVQLPKGTELQIRSRSGLAAKDGVIVLNSPGTIDEDYRGEIGVILLWNGYNDKEISSLNACENTYSVGDDTGQYWYTITDRYVYIKKGMRIAQGIVCPVLHPEIIEVDSLDSTERSSGGFGSTGL